MKTKIRNIDRYFEKTKSSPVILEIKNKATGKVET
jgi:hypothetical protein